MAKSTWRTLQWRSGLILSSIFRPDRQRYNTCYGAPHTLLVFLIWIRFIVQLCNKWWNVESSCAIPSRMNHSFLGWFSLSENTESGRICSLHSHVQHALITFSFSHIYTYFSPMSNEMPPALIFMSLQEYLIFLGIQLLRCIYQGCGSMEMKIESAFQIFALKIKGI